MSAPSEFPHFVRVPITKRIDPLDDIRHLMHRYNIANPSLSTSTAANTPSLSHLSEPRFAEELDFATPLEPPEDSSAAQQLLPPIAEQLKNLDSLLERKSRRKGFFGYVAEEYDEFEEEAGAETASNECVQASSATPPLSPHSLQNDNCKAPICVC